MPSKLAAQHATQRRDAVGCDVERLAVDDDFLGERRVAPAIRQRKILWGAVDRGFNERPTQLNLAVVPVGISESVLEAKDPEVGRVFERCVLERTAAALADIWRLGAPNQAPEPVHDEATFTDT